MAKSSQTDSDESSGNVNKSRMVLVTGPAGAGRSTAIKYLEDMGFECFDNMPLDMVGAVLQKRPSEGDVAIGFDARTRGYSEDAIVNLLAVRGVISSLLYLECSDDVLLARFNETRRRHPFAPEDSPEQGISADRDSLRLIKPFIVDTVDTTDLTPNDLRAELFSRYGDLHSGSITVSVQSFSYKKSVPREADIVIDCRFLRNPHWMPELRALNGMDREVERYVMDDPLYQSFFDAFMKMLKLLVPAYDKHGKNHLNIGFGCTGGQHRSVCVAENVARELQELGRRVVLRHREIPAEILPGNKC